MKIRPRNLGRRATSLRNRGRTRNQRKNNYSSTVRIDSGAMDPPTLPFCGVVGPLEFYFSNLNT